MAQTRFPTLQMVGTLALGMLLITAILVGFPGHLTVPIGFFFIVSGFVFVFRLIAYLIRTS